MPPCHLCPMRVMYVSFQYSVAFVLFLFISFVAVCQADDVLVVAESMGTNYILSSPAFKGFRDSLTRDGRVIHKGQCRGPMKET